VIIDKIDFLDCFLNLAFANFEFSEKPFVLAKLMWTKAKLVW
jgi:hypothetical protein